MSVLMRSFLFVVCFFMLAENSFSQTNLFPSIGVGLEKQPDHLLQIHGSHGNTRMLLNSFGGGTEDKMADLVLWASEPGLTYSGVGIGNNVINTTLPPYIKRISNVRGGSYMRFLENSIYANIVNVEGKDVRVLTVDGNGNMGVGFSSPNSKLTVNGGISVDGVNSIGSVNGFNNCIQLVNGGHAAIVYNPGQASELMFGMHSNGNFYWGTGQNSSVGMKYVMTLSNNGLLANVSAVAIGCSNPGSYKLAVEGTIGAREVVVLAPGTAWPDYVFAPEYKLRTLDEIEQFVKAKQHLPDVPSAEAVAKDGVNLGEMNAILLRKVEELTLHLIELSKENAIQSNENALQRKEIDLLMHEIASLKK